MCSTKEALMLSKVNSHIQIDIHLKKVDVIMSYIRRTTSLVSYCCNNIACSSPSDKAMTVLYDDPQPLTIAELSLLQYPKS